MAMKSVIAVGRRVQGGEAGGVRLDVADLRAVDPAQTWHAVLAGGPSSASSRPSSDSSTATTSLPHSS